MSINYTEFYSSNFPTIKSKNILNNFYDLHPVALRKSGMIEIALAETIG